jgi:hypothetical protein
MIHTTDDLLDYIFNSEKDTPLPKIENEANILEYCRINIHNVLLSNAKVKKDIKTDIVWIPEVYELVKRYKIIADKYNLSINAIFPFKLQNMLQWLFDSGSMEIPHIFLYYKSEINGMVWYLHNSFLKKVKFVMLLNEHGNHLYENDSHSIIQFYKFLIQQQHLTRNDLMQYWPQKNYRKEFVQRLKELDLADTGNSNSLFEMINTGVFGNYDIKQLIESTFGEQVDLKTDTTTKEEIRQFLQQNETKKMMEDNKVIKVLDQATIDELQLTIFDVKTIKKKNLILYIFIDKDNMKRYYYEPFEFTFFISTDSNIINNDYIQDYNPGIHIAYTMTDYNMVSKFKFMLTDQYKKHMIKFLK